MKFRDWSLYQKIWTLVALLLFFFALSIFYSIYTLKAIDSTISELSHVHYEARGLAFKITDKQRFMVIQTRNMIIESDLKKVGDIMTSFKKAGTDQDALFTRIEQLLSPSETTELAHYKENRTKWFALIDKAYDLKIKNNAEESKQIIFQAQTEILDGMLKTLDTIRTMTGDKADNAAEAASKSVSNATKFSIALGAISGLLSALIAFYVIKGLKFSIQRIISTLSENARNVASASHQIASTAEELSQASTEQAASLEQTSSSIEEMNSMVAKNSENASKAAETTHESQEHAREGQQAVAKMISAMSEINNSNNSIMEQVENSNKQITEIVAVIKEIGAKTKVINDIVFQTKLLSFNASVEAARAGEQGKGFAVVAEEVGNLAAMSGNAAKEISDLLENSITKVETIVNETKTKVGAEVLAGKDKVKTGTEIAHQCGSLLDTIVSEVSSISKMAEEISVASHEQASGVSEISKAVTQLDTVTQQNSASSEETASAAEELSAQAESLNIAVIELVTTIEGSTKKADDHGSAQVLKMEKKKTIATSHQSPPLKKAVGLDTVPRNDHKGFEEV